jgi:hypothetical protein
MVSTSKFPHGRISSRYGSLEHDTPPIKMYAETCPLRTNIISTLYYLMITSVSSNGVVRLSTRPRW